MTAPFAVTSGDPLADRRMDMAGQLAARGDVEAAADLMKQALDIAPDWAAGHFRLAEFLERSGDSDGAARAYAACLGIDPQDHCGAGLRLALMGRIPRPDRLPDAYVRALFDDYAPRFDRALVDRLGYRAPALLRQAYDRARPGVRTGRALDLGCGTGLAAQAFRDCADAIDGVDLSPGMIAVAAEKGIYDTLEVGDIADYPERCARVYGLVLSADALLYLGALETVFEKTLEILEEGGLFCFTVQKGEGCDYVLGSDHRYAYGRAYLESCAAGYRILGLEPCILRQDGGRDVEGWIGVWEKIKTREKTKSRERSDADPGFSGS